MNTLLENISSRLLHKAATIQGHIEELKEKLRQVLEQKEISVTVSAGVETTGRRRMSLGARRRIAAAQRARWAKQRNETAGAAAPTKSRRGGMSAAGRARLAEAAKRRWAKAKASGKNAL
jgi:hypothetical protein